MICQSCQTENPEGFNFCMNSPAPLRYSCPGFGQANGTILILRLALKPAFNELVKRNLSLSRQLNGGGL